MIRFLLLCVLVAGMACDYKPSVCKTYGKRHVEATDDTSPRVFGCAIYKCGATTTHHEAYDEDVCVAWQGDK